MGTFFSKLKYRATIRESLRVSAALSFGVAARIPRALIQRYLSDPIFLGEMRDQDRLKEISGTVFMATMDALGPAYGKLAQTWLSRVPASQQSILADWQLLRVYGDWPPMPFSTVLDILDEHIPMWRKRFSHIDPAPLGVASMAQVHVATAFDGREWVVKVLKPRAKKKLHGTILAIREIADKLSLGAAFYSPSRRIADELLSLTNELSRESDLREEAANIDRLHELMVNRRSVLRIPEVMKEFISSEVLVIERFKGIRLSDVVGGHIKLSELQRKSLAQDILRELLVQIFELGLFHADPHAGNLILLEDGSVGLFDWGLTGELVEGDRQMIAALLRAVMTSDIEAVADVLVKQGEASLIKINKEKLLKDLKGLADQMKKPNEDKTSAKQLHHIFDRCMRIAAKHRIPIPTGLLLMAKAIITIDGLARGIDPKIAMARVAAPLLLKAANPGISDWVKFAWNQSTRVFRSDSK